MKITKITSKILLFIVVLLVVMIIPKKRDLQENKILVELHEQIGNYDEQQIVLKNTTKEEAKQIAKRFNAKLRITNDGSFAAITLPEGLTILDVVNDKNNQDILDKLSIDYHASIADIEEVEKEYLPKEPIYSVIDKDYNKQTYLNYINIGNAWNYTSMGSNVTIAIIDTGIDTDHPEFIGRISEYSYNATEDKIVKDYQDLEGNYDFSLIEDEQGHGTAVAGVVAASMNNGEGITGIAPNVNIIVIKAESDEKGNFKRTSDLVFGLYYAIERDVDVVNMSFGTTENLFDVPVRLAVDSDIICVAAAGNDSTPTLTYPAACQNVIGVGALANESFVLANYSNYGDNTNIVAPGTVYTTSNDGSYKVMNGTSFASPVVAASICLYLSNNQYQTFKEVTERLYASTIDLGALGEDFYYGYGALDVNAFIVEEVGTITFNYLTDEIEETEQLFIRNHTLQNIPKPERLYSVFDGWYYDIDCTEEYNLYQDEFITDLTLYAKWANEDDAVPYTYVELEDGTIEIRSYTGRRRYITIPDYIDDKVVSSIGDNAFEGENRLREINLPRYLVNIGMNAFKDCSSLTKITIPDSVKYIGSKAFENNIRLSEVAFSNNSELLTIGSFAFSNCSSLYRFDIPKTVTNLDGSAFFGTIRMKAINAHKNSKNYSSVDGILFNKNKNTLIAYPASLNQEYVLPSKVTRIGDYAFGYTKELTVDLTNVKSIGNNAFAYSNISSIVIPDSVTKLGSAVFEGSKISDITLGRGIINIPQKTFTLCLNLETISIPKEILSIDGLAFANSNLKEITFEENSNLLNIDSMAFAYTNLNSITIPDSVTTIGSSAFKTCLSLEEVILSENSNLKMIGNNAFEETISLETIYLPESLIKINDYAFLKSGLVGTINIPLNVSYLGAGAFASCYNLENIYVDDENTSYQDVDGVVYNKELTELVQYPTGRKIDTYQLLDTTLIVKDSAFYGAKYLNYITLSEKLTNIERYGFYNSGLYNVYIPENIIQISNYAFANSSNLSNVDFSENSKLPRLSYASFANTGLYSFNIPANVSTMSQEVFIGCKNLTSITFKANSQLESISAYMFKGCESLQTITFENGSSLRNIQAHGLEGMKNLQTIDFGDAIITNIDNYAFRYCENLTEVKLTNGLTYIGRYAFYGCKFLKRLDIPSTIEYIGQNAFYHANELNLYFESNTLPLYLQENWDNGIRGYYLCVSEVLSNEQFRYAKLTNGSISIIEYLGSEETVDLSNINLNGNISSIGGYAFYRKNITNVILPNTLTMISQYAFAYSKIQNITLPDNVTYIAKYAFYKSDLELINISETSKLQKIEQYAFSKCNNLTSIYLPSELTTLEKGVFSESGLTNVTFDENINLTTIPQYAFMDTKLVNVTLPNSLTLIDHSAFGNIKTLETVTFGTSDLQLMSNVFYNTGLNELYIPENITYIGEYALIGLENLKAYQVDENNPKYTSINGVLFSKDKKKLIAYPANLEGSYTVPNHVETIGFGAFENSKLTNINFEENINLLTIGYRAFFKANIEEITIPNTVVSIDYYAFAYCKDLTTVKFEEGSRLTGIYEGAFYNCKSLVDITLPETIVEISDFSFYGCMKLDKLPTNENTNLKGIYDYAFAYTGLTNLNLPESVIDLGNYSFMGSKLESIYIPDTNAKQLIIGIGAFEQCNKLENITLPFIGASFDDMNITWFGYIFGAGSYEANNTYVPETLKEVTIQEGLTTIGYGAFYGIRNVEKLNLPTSITYLDTISFDCTSVIYQLSNEVYPLNEDGFVGCFGENVEGTITIGEGVLSLNGDFASCSRIEEIFLPDSITRIDDYEFSSCVSLTNVNFNENVVYIGESAFWDCKSLEKVYISKNVSFIGKNAFYNCNSIVNIKFEEENKWYSYYDNIIYNKDYTEMITHINPRGILTILGSVNVVKNNFFLGTTNIVEVVLEEGIKNIGEESFAYCSSITSITLPSTLENIEVNAFTMAYHLTEVINYSEIDVYALRNEYGSVSYYANKITQDGETKILYDDMEGYSFVDTEDGFRFLYYNGQYRLISYFGNELEVRLPESINGSSYIIDRVKGLKSIIIPSSFETINANAFLENSSIEKVVLEEGIKYIDDSAFCSCTSLINVELPQSLISIGRSAFSGCNNLEYIYLPENVEYIGSGAFAYIDSINIEISKMNKYLKEIDGVIYSNNGSEISYVKDNISGTIHLSETLEKIPYRAFVNQSAITEIIIPDSVRVIESDAFMGCNGLKKVIISDGVESIYDDILGGCANLEYVYIGKKVSEINNFLGNCPKLEMVEISDENPYFEIYNDILFNESKSVVYFALPYISGNVILPESVSEIKSNAFSGCINIETIILSEGIKEIPYRCFSDCVSLINISLPDSVTTVGYSAFSGSGLLTINLNCVKYIDSYAFHNCFRMTEITVYENLETIQTYAFEGCTGLNIINNNSILEFIIGDHSHGGISQNAKIIIDRDGNKTYYNDKIGFEVIETKNGLVFYKENEKYTLVSYFGNEETVTLPLQVNGFDYDIKNVSGIKKLIIPEGMTEIPAYAFSNSMSLEEVTLSSTVELICAGAFNNCINLKGVYNLENVKEIEDGAFNNCTSLCEIQFSNKLESLGRSALYHCESLNNIELPDTIKTLYNDTFRYTGYSNDLENWENGALYCDGYLISIDNDIEYLSIKENTINIAEKIFEDCYSLRTLEINCDYKEGLRELTNLETLIINCVPSHQISDYFGISTPLTFKTLILSNEFYAYQEFSLLKFENIDIFVDQYKEDIMWDHDYPNWNNGNKVYYKGEWIKLEFSDENGESLYINYQSINEVIKVPYFELESDKQYHYIVDGWDIDNDGIVDSLPATSPVDIIANPIIRKELRNYTINFYDKDNSTVLYQYTLPYGSTVTLPENPTKKGYTFISWQGYEEGVAVTSNIDIYSTWEHEGTGHNYTLEEIVNPTCEEKGYTKHICEICDEWYATDYVDALGHNYTSQVVDPTCEEKGYTLYTCACTHSYKDNYISALGHNLEGWKTVVEPTCELEGEEHNDCTNCDHHETRTIEVLEHNFESTVITEATCEKQGVVKHVCSECEFEYQEVIETLEHNYVQKYVSKTFIEWLISLVLNVFFGYENNLAYYYECVDCKHIKLKDETLSTSASVLGTCEHSSTEVKVIKEVLCFEEGYKSTVCTLCNETIKLESIPQLGEHNLIHHNELKATCTTTGHKAYEECTRCDYTTYEEVLALGHTEVIDKAVKPTCTETGLTEGKHCSVCNEVLVKQEIIDALGHSYSDWKVVKEPTEEETGLKQKVCSNCNDIIEKVIPTLTHTHNHSSVVTEPTCTEKGYTTYTCSCGDTYVDNYVDALGHSYSEWKEILKPTCTKEGKEQRNCNNCDHFDEKSISKIAHNYKETIVEPTCTEQGYTLHRCDQCNDEYTDNHKEKFGHTESDWIIDKEPTTESVGQKHTECTLCGETIKTDTIPMIVKSGCGNFSMVKMLSIINLLGLVMIIRKRFK